MKFVILITSTIMQDIRIVFLSILLFSAPVAADMVCAKNFSELEQTQTLASLKSVIINGKQNGFVNKTRGSYFFLQASDVKFHITFYTTGLFDLYGIRREGSIKFCDKDGQLLAIGLERTQNIYIDHQRLEFGLRTARESFIRGPMPEKLASINSVDPVTVAAY